jgi:hypothetical protein
MLAFSPFKDLSPKEVEYFLSEEVAKRRKENLINSLKDLNLNIQYSIYIDEIEIKEQ